MHTCLRGSILGLAVDFVTVGFTNLLKGMQLFGLKLWRHIILKLHKLKQTSGLRFQEFESKSISTETIGFHTIFSKWRDTGVWLNWV